MASQAFPPQEDGIPMPQRIFAVLAISFGIVMGVLDASIANIALPSIATDLGVSVAASIWVVNSFQLTVAVLLLAISSAAEILGLRRVFWVGLLIFTAASAACGLSGSITALIISRSVQGVGAACIFATYPALIAHIYPRRMLGRGIGISATIVSLSNALGPTVAAGILSVARWEWLFLVNIPIGILGLVIGARALPHTSTWKRPFDVPAAVASGAMIGLAVIGIDGLGRPDDRVLAIVEIAAALGIGALLWRWQGREATPLVPIDLLRLPVFSLSVITSICSYAPQSIVLIALPFYFQHTLGWSPVATGLIMTPIPLAVATIGVVAGRLADRYPAGVLCGIGLLVMATGLGLLVLLPDNPGVLNVVWREFTVGLGFGLFQTPNNRALLSSGPRHRSASAGGMLAVARLMGQTGGVSLVGVFSSLSGNDVTTSVLIAATGITLIGAVSSFTRLGVQPVVNR